MNVKSVLLQFLICPSCLPKEISLKATTRQVESGDILNGFLECTSCGERYPIQNGVARLLPKKSSKPGIDLKYETDFVVSSYLWSHYSDLLADSPVDTAYPIWSSYLYGNYSNALDIGCATGRLTFEMSVNSEFGVEMDMSVNFVRESRRIMQQREICFDKILEGEIVEEVNITLPDKWHYEQVDFIVADALSLPFPKSLFSLVTSLNMLDKVAKPLKHLTEANRVALSKGATFFSQIHFRGLKRLRIKKIG